MINIILQGEPKSTSHIYKVRNCGNFVTVYMSKEGKDIKESYQWQAKSQYKGLPIAESIEVTVKLFFGTKRRCDIDNFGKLWQDAMTGILWIDDSQIMIMYLSKHYDKNAGRIELAIKRL
jgi:Holliday junction resolvase RusA-like endonuclease